MPDRIGQSNFFNVFSNEYFINVETGETVHGKIQVRVEELDGKLLRVQAGQRIHSVDGDKIEDFLKVVRQD
ncbi:hypothetical protein A2130_03315 [Candidatus Woesebacteria bacterium GWC2_33_12]|uniref:Uncharacterized protein n=1 Tax=Candidatus Woesebacteria bacterium GW2011_GWB1_33_22 TaxID=1618566 RepID=A0A0G0CM56_9BACT|nr:MAG: hypothetical protein UR29_C0004G0028 [Candidatus Woesebacteria bacterium GW2011_GWC2_33_12]KKP41898.1 MAG: hypothetical protein UR33_C0008G0017 [Candidatus Woesebacteria bacterium GW2011_GWA2_33_20]KKP44472.1 MAG: hypothetical protein UR35_C0008G0017 [Candidatus Woesebacteria bacterium GW2011_GWB1_33_22]KKP46322.1 MAG: hypothetical protein UR37_C0009G0017 [Microgenomates group bacterium GW2011_GWC1_33_28]KKP50419.1 MAG: hypothetical protein UR41_C0008G0017 [Candidatus Woesebacteria bact